MTWGEVHGGGAVAAFVALDDINTLVGSLRRLDLVASELLDVGAADDEQTCEVSVTEPLLRHPIAEWARHGVVASRSASGSQLSVRRSSAQEANTADRETSRSALASGVGVTSEAWAAPQSAAAQFLATERVLDAHVD